MNDLNTSLDAFEELVKFCCSDPTKVTVDYADTEWTCDVCITAASDDVKRIVGKGGSNFKELASILYSITHRSGRQFALAPVQAIPGGTEGGFAPFRARADWPEKKVREVVKTICEAAFVGSNPRVSINPAGENKGFESVVSVKLTTPHKRPAGLFGRALAQVLRVAGVQLGRMLTTKVTVE